MKRFKQLQDITATLEGGIAVIRTDTIYGIVAQAHNESAVERIFALKGRDDDKSPIVLIADESAMLDAVSEKVRDSARGFLLRPKTTVIVPHNSPTFSWITRGNNSIAYRIPQIPELLALLHQSGPLIAPSANPQGEVPAATIDEALAYFGDKVDAYVDGGKVLDNTPSTIVRINHDGSHTVLRGEI